MIPLFGFIAGTALATGPEWGVAIGGHGSRGLKTGIPVRGVDGSLVYRWQHDAGRGVQVELQDLWGLGPSGGAHLLGLKVSASRLWGDEAGSVRPYGSAGLGGYVNDVLPVLPMLWLESGVEWKHERVCWRVGPTLYALPPFFVGGGLRIALTLATEED